MILLGFFNDAQLVYMITFCNRINPYRVDKTHLIVTIQNFRAPFSDIQFTAYNLSDNYITLTHEFS